MKVVAHKQLRRVGRAQQRLQRSARGPVTLQFVPGLADISLIARLAEASPLPLNIMVDEGTPSLRALAKHGVARVSQGPRPYLVAMKALEQAARAASAWPSSRVRTGTM